MLYKFEQGFKTMEIIKNICCAKGEDTVDQNTEILLGLQEPWWSGKDR